MTQWGLGHSGFHQLQGPKCQGGEEWLKFSLPFVHEAVHPASGLDSPGHRLRGGAHKLIKETGSESSQQFLLSVIIPVALPMVTRDSERQT